MTTAMARTIPTEPTMIAAIGLRIGWLTEQVNHRKTGKAIGGTQLGERFGSS
jgi:hypothetical protein